MVRRSMRTRVLPVGAMVMSMALASIMASGCGNTNPDRVDILAASSYTDVAPALESLLEAELDVDVEFSFGSSGAFLEQVRQGSPASIVITADASTMERIDAAGLVDRFVPIATNELVVVTADSDAGRQIDDVVDLETGSAVVVVCASSAPCGAATDALFDRAGLNVDVSSREPNVRATLTKVRLGEADAAVVYRTDAIGVAEVRTVPIDAADNISVVGHAGSVRDSEASSAVLDLLTGPDAAAALIAAGFGAP